MAASILIADDDAVARRLLENMVQKCGYETVVVDSGDAAIAMLTAPDAQPIDAVVLDLVMPGLDGMGVLAKIREAGLNIPSSYRPPMAASTMWCRRCAPAPRISWSSRSASSGCRYRCATRSMPVR